MVRVTISRVDLDETDKLIARMLEINKILLTVRKSTTPDNKLPIKEYNRYMVELKQITAKLHQEVRK